MVFFKSELDLKTYFDNRQNTIMKQELQTKFKLKEKYKKLDKRFTEDVRILKMKRDNCFRKNVQWYKSIYKSEMSNYSSFLRDPKGEPLVCKIEVTGSDYVKNRFSDILPGEPICIDEKDEQPHEQVANNLSFYDKLKAILENFKKMKIELNCQRINNVEIHHQGLSEQFYDPSLTEKMDVLREELKKITLQEVGATEPPKQTKRQETPSVSEVDVENRIKHIIPDDKDTDLERDIKLFQRLLRGRAYQTMMMTARTKYQPAIQRYEEIMRNKAVRPESPCKVDTIFTFDEILDISTKRFVSRFFDSIFKESIMLHEVNKNKMLNELADVTRAMREAAESKIRCAEDRRRQEHEEMFKQVMKVHHDIGVLFTEKLVEVSIEQCAKEEGRKLVDAIISSRENCNDTFFYKRYFGHNNLETELLYNFIIPEAYKIIREDTFDEEIPLFK